VKAITYTHSGGPEVLKLREVPEPAPADEELLVKVQALGLNAMDSHLMRGIPLVQGFFDLFSKSVKIPGVDFSGTVVKLGSAVTAFKVGDEVFGAARGSMAEYVSAKQSNVVLKPAGISFESAAVLSVAGLSALQGLRDHGRLQPGQDTLIYGAGGGVGTFAVQIAKAMGAKVTAVCGGRNRELMKTLGADEIFDYSIDEYAAKGKKYDLILIVNGYRSLQTHYRALKENGICVMIGAAKAKMFRALLQVVFIRPWLSFGSKKIKVFIAKLNNKDLNVLAEMLKSGKVRAVIDRSYTLEQGAEAIRHLEEWHTGGKILVNEMR